MQSELDWRVYLFPQETNLMKYLLLMYAYETILKEHPFLTLGTDEFTVEVSELPR
jgi:hypothetical protein